jgi:hypothetical protein
MPKPRRSATSWNCPVGDWVTEKFTGRLAAPLSPGLLHADATTETPPT